MQNIKWNVLIFFKIVPHLVLAFNPITPSSFLLNEPYPAIVLKLYFAFIIDSLFDPKSYLSEEFFR